ncbi:MAG: hypothetical protein JXA66_07790 [Oligoflexia bacterium]|nr:hypothetical protein [Oligoflexia bacterium]
MSISGAIKNFLTIEEPTGEDLEYAKFRIIFFHVAIIVFHPAWGVFLNYILPEVYDPMSKIACLKEGVNDFILKPFDNEGLKARIFVQLRLKNLYEVNSLLEMTTDSVKRISDYIWMILEQAKKHE